MYYSTTILIIVLGGGAGTIRGVSWAASSLSRSPSPAYRARIQVCHLRLGAVDLVFCSPSWRRCSIAVSRCWEWAGDDDASAPDTAPCSQFGGCKRTTGGAGTSRIDSTCARVSCAAHRPNGSGKSTLFDCTGLQRPDTAPFISTAPTSPDGHESHRGKRLPAQLPETVVFER